MFTPDEEAAIAAAESITSKAFGEMSIEDFQGLLFQVGAMLTVWRTAMVGAGYSNLLIEKSAWLLLTQFFGHHLTETTIQFEPDQSIPEGRSSSDQRGAGAVHSPEG